MVHIAIFNFRNLKGLKLTNLPSVKNMGLMILLLEDAIPELTVFGVEPHQMLPPGTDFKDLADRVEAIASTQEVVDAQKTVEGMQVTVASTQERDREVREGETPSRASVSGIESSSAIDSKNQQGVRKQAQS
jgi:hypothetical protein